MKPTNELVDQANVNQDGGVVAIDRADAPSLLRAGRYPLKFQGILDFFLKFRAERSGHALGSQKTRESISARGESVPETARERRAAKDRAFRGLLAASKNIAEICRAERRSVTILDLEKLEAAIEEVERRKL